MRKRAPAWRSGLGRRIKVHDRHQFELKLEYKPPPNERHSRYVVDVYVCMPSSLNISPDTVPREQLYADIHNYVRLKTPEFSWSELGALPSSPLLRAADELVALQRGGDARRFIYECRMLACIFRASLRDAIDRAERALGELKDGTPADVERVAEECDERLEGARSILERFRALAARVERAEIPERARAAFSMADEYMSIAVEQRLRRVIVAAARASLQPAAAAAATALKKLLLAPILAEESYRRERGYLSIIDPHSDNEPYIYRAGLLKKYCSSALFLEIHRAHSRKPWQELFFAMAAGIAMAFATIVAFWAQRSGRPLGLQLFLILVVAYMFKDRLKEATRGLFTRFLERTLYDRKIIIEDPAGGAALGSCREKIDYLQREGMPAEAQEIRRRGLDATTRAAMAELHETVMHYKKEIKISSRPLLERAEGVTDIVRFHIARLLHEMDEPDQEIEYVDADTHALGPVRAAKTYSVDVVFRFQAQRGLAPRTTLVRLVLDRNGIKRIERTDGPEGRPSGEMPAV